VGRVGVVVDGEEGSLGNRLGRGKLPGVDFVVDEVVVRDLEVLAGGDAKGESSTGAHVVLASGDGCESFRPRGLVGDGFRAHEASSTEDEMR